MGARRTLLVHPPLSLPSILSSCLPVYSSPFCRCLHKWSSLLFESKLLQWRLFTMPIRCTILNTHDSDEWWRQNNSGEEGKWRRKNASHTAWNILRCKPYYLLRSTVTSSGRISHHLIHTDVACQAPHVSQEKHTTENTTPSTSVVNDNTGVKLKRKKLKGKRATIKWLKLFRWQKKKEYERMTPDEKILYKLKKAQRKEERLVQALAKIKPPSPPSEIKHDPEILTPEEHFYFLKMGTKCKNYVPVGRRGIFQGVILNMHLHWKKHETLKVVVKTFTPEEVEEIAAELARLSGGIVLDIQEGNIIIMYRGKNYSQPPPEIMSPRITLSRKKALDKSKFRDALHAVRTFIPKLECQLETVHASISSSDSKEKLRSENALGDGVQHNHPSEFSDPETSENVYDPSRRGPVTEVSDISEPESLSDIFETDSEQDKGNDTLYLDALGAMPAEDDGDDMSQDFEDYLRQFSTTGKVDNVSGDVKKVELDDIDRLFLSAGTLLKKKK